MYSDEKQDLEKIIAWAKDTLFNMYFKITKTGLVKEDFMAVPEQDLMIHLVAEQTLF